MNRFQDRGAKEVNNKKTIVLITVLIAVPLAVGMGASIDRVSRFNKLDIGHFILASLDVEKVKQPCSPRTANLYMRLFRGDEKDLQWLKASNGLYFILQFNQAPPNKRYELATFFINKGFDVNTKLLHDFTALHAAIGKNSKADASFLLSNGADTRIATTVNLTPEDDNKVRRGAIEYAKALSKIDGKDRSAIIELLTNK